MNIIKKLFGPLCLAALMMIGATACDATEKIENENPNNTPPPATTPITYTLNLTADKTTALRGDEITLSAFLHAEGEEDVAAEGAAYQIVEGGSYATLTSNKITIGQNAPHNTIIKAKAKVGATDSNIIEIKVNVPLTGVSISAGNVTNVMSGNSVSLTKTLSPAGADTSALQWKITEGADYCTMNGDVLIVNANVATGTIIKVQAVSGEIESNELSFIVGYPLEDITVSIGDVTNVLKGESVTLTKTITPSQADVSAFQWQITEGATACSISGDVLMVKSNATTGTIVKVKAVCGDVESNEISFIVGYPITEITVGANGVTNILKGSNLTLTKTVLPEEADATEAQWQIVEGSSACSINGNVLSVNANATTGTVIKLKAVNGEVESDELSFIVGYPITDINVSANGVTNILAGNSMTLTKTVLPEEADAAEAQWQITEGNNVCTVNGNVLSVNAGVETGTVIKLKAVCGEVESDELSFIVGYPLQELRVSVAGSTNVSAGSTVTLNVTRIPANTTNGDYTWDITQGEGYCTIENDKLIIDSETPFDTVIKFKAVGAVESDEITVVIGIPIEGISVSSTAPAILEHGGSYDVSFTATPAGASTHAVTWRTLDENDNPVAWANVANGKLNISSNAPHGVTLIVKAISGSIESNELSFQVGIALESLTLAVVGVDANEDGKYNIEPTESCTFNVTRVPAATTDSSFEYDFVSGENLCEIFGDRLQVKKGATIGQEIKVRVVNGDIASEYVTIIVGVPVEGLTLSSTAPSVLAHGGNYPLNVAIAPTNASAQPITWVLSNENWASVAGNVLYVNQNAPHGSTLTVKAVCGGKESNVLSFQIGVALTGLNLSMAGSKNVDPNSSRTFSVTRIPAESTDTTYELVAVAGAQYCSIVGNVLTVNEDAPIGAVISVKAVNGTIESNVIADIIVGKPITAINATVNSTEIVKGNMAILSATTTPANATAKYNWVIVEGDAFATLTDNILTVAKNATTGATIKVKAVCGDVESNVITITVMPTQEEINASTYRFILDDELKIDTAETSIPVLEAMIINANGEEITDKPLVFEVIDGAEFLSITYSGYVCNFKALGHGEATVRVYIDGISDISKETKVNVVVPPEFVDLPEVFRGTRLNYTFNYALTDYTSTSAAGKPSALPFVCLPSSSAGKPNPCTDLVYTFAHEDGTTGDAVATYANGKITFKKTGNVTVTATSNSGSIREQSVSYNFNINNGYNVYSFQEAASFLPSDAYTGQIVNFVALEKVVGNVDHADDINDGVADGKYNYGYAFVPETALKPKSEQSFEEVKHAGKTRIIAVNKSAHINGNNFTVDASNLRVILESEINEYYGENGTGKDVAEANRYLTHGALVAIEPYQAGMSNGEGTITGDFYAIINDLSIKGNAPITYENKVTPGLFRGAYEAGIVIGHVTQPHAKYLVDVNNVTAEGFKNGFMITNAVSREVEGKVVPSVFENAYAHNCWQNGIGIRSSIITMRNLKLGACGAAGIEMYPEFSNQAGNNNNEAQQITFEGSIDAKGNLHKMDTSYLNTYNIDLTALGAGKFTFDMIYNASLSVLRNSLFGAENTPEINAKWANILGHMQTSDQQVSLALIMVADVGTLAPNHTVPSYVSELGGIIDAANLPTASINTTHAFIRMPIKLNESVTLGTVLLYNIHYGKTA
ncbi:MAG: hypothetical protein E7355_05375 [Clostridiales bacterium]|nr:hypothetical protein [Clostridiales bacterium]